MVPVFVRNPLMPITQTQTQMPSPYLLPVTPVNHFSTTADPFIMHAYLQRQFNQLNIKLQAIDQIFAQSSSYMMSPYFGIRRAISSLQNTSCHAFNFATYLLNKKVASQFAFAPRPFTNLATQTIPVMQPAVQSIVVQPEKIQQKESINDPLEMTVHKPEASPEKENHFLEIRDLLIAIDQENIIGTQAIFNKIMMSGLDNFLHLDTLFFFYLKKKMFNEIYEIFKIKAYQANSTAAWYISPQIVHAFFIEGHIEEAYEMFNFVKIDDKIFDKEGSRETLDVSKVSYSIAYFLIRKHTNSIPNCNLYIKAGDNTKLLKYLLRANYPYMPFQEEDSTTLLIKYS